MWTCQYCSEPFVPKDLKHLERNPPKYCSRQCARRHAVQLKPFVPPIVRCSTCHKDFENRQGPAKPVPQYCSRACFHASQTTRVALVCRQCEVSFERRRYMQAWSQHEGPFCSMACYADWQRGRTKTPAPRPPKTGPQWERPRLAALERDQYRCVDCGSEDRLEVHHIVTWKPGDPHELDNLATLCVPCHRRRHPRKRELAQTT